MALAGLQELELAVLGAAAAEEVVASMSHQDDVEWARVVEATTAIVILAVVGGAIRGRSSH